MTALSHMLFELYYYLKIFFNYIFVFNILHTQVGARKTLLRLLIRGNIHRLDKDLLGRSLQLSSARPYRAVQNSRKRDLGSYLRKAMIYDTFGYISGDKQPELRPRASCHESKKEPQVSADRR